MKDERGQSGISAAGVLSWAYLAGQIATFVFLTFFDGYIYNWWNWLIACAANAFLSAIWPIYWALRLAMGN